MLFWTIEKRNKFYILEVSIIENINKRCPQDWDHSTKGDQNISKNVDKDYESINIQNFDAGISMFGMRCGWQERTWKMSMMVGRWLMPHLRRSVMVSLLKHDIGIDVGINVWSYSITIIFIFVLLSQGQFGIKFITFFYLYKICLRYNLCIFCQIIKIKNTFKNQNLK